jgi:hypothetical protein
MVLSTRRSAIIVASVLVVGLIVLLWSRCDNCMVVLPWFSSQPLVPPNKSIETSNDAEVNNQLSYLYIAGIEGVGHHRIAPALGAVAAGCGYHVFHRHKLLRKLQYTMHSKQFKEIVMNTLHASNPHVASAKLSSKILILDDGSFPSGNIARNSTYAMKKAEGVYNLEWIHEQVRSIAGVDLKFIYLSRDFYETVASRPTIGGEFLAHALILYDFIWYIHEEFDTIEAKEPDLWRQIAHNWFVELKNCPKLVESVVRFTGWTDCNVKVACSKVTEIMRPEEILPKVNQSEQEFIKHLQTSLNIPYLDYAPN